MSSKNQPNGEGRLVGTDGNIYQGDLKNGKMSGQGVYYDAEEGSLYEGAFANDKQHGLGKEIWNEGSYVYTGAFQKGEKTGKGKFDFDGCWYEGDFVDGNMHGNGKYYFADTGRTYQGQFVRNQIQGKGVLSQPTLWSYEGDFNDGMMSGSGIKTLSDGSRYEGEFSNDKYHGAAVWYNYADQTKRQGEWAHGKRVAWLSQPVPCEVLANGEITDAATSDQRKTGSLFSKSGKLYKGGAWQERLLSGLNRDFDLQNVSKGGAKGQQVKGMKNVTGKKRFATK